ncbi:CD276 antigen-like [Pygocentrus nattereri]|uniref:Ig-like domain-containing protein n=1 Tax=Pygocentrus nattereri TaxID=42514 RepID=A0A3B4CW81_PYGNA|nr:CD276 antigen-like [Pygocentrus nattereri]XP_037389844.1 CD276 antigen-like [Pygocentrus nattereri]XP_037389845.1 CD276 antigen-like [Pygocentrus nattereri]XP_037389847.1 CD276 antigen-like [Pygocentrus nattereri]XP_037389848.1 CD276 antigen-like [Pygocentrus nattereri]XP_037389849.1 CD276 antigen-like [Pygocentrus nattereri]
MRCFLFWMAVTILVRRVQHPVSPAAVAAPGGNATLECSFSTSKNLNLTNLIINWQHGETVVHSFYLGQDQLDRQGQAYKGRTHLFKDELLEGNASLRLIRMQPDDEGEYSCYVNNEQDSTTRRLKVILAALFDEPLLSLQPTCDSINITATLSNGFPQPEIRWFDSSGRDILQTSTIQLDTRGRYKVSSTISSRQNAIETITMEMKLEVLNQSFTRSLLLHPPPDPCQECCSTPFTSRNRTAMATVVTLFVTFILILMFAVKKWKASHGQQEHEQAM